MNDHLHTLDPEPLEALRQAVAVILGHAENEFLPAPLESELYLFRDRLNAALGS